MINVPPNKPSRLVAQGNKGAGARKDMKHTWDARETLGRVDVKRVCESLRQDRGGTRMDRQSATFWTWWTSGAKKVG